MLGGKKRKISLLCDQWFSERIVNPGLIREYVEKGWEMYEFYMTEKLY